MRSHSGGQIRNLRIEVRLKSTFNAQLAERTPPDSDWCPTRDTLARKGHSDGRTDAEMMRCDNDAERRE